jgi:hypothetical protein
MNAFRKTDFSQRKMAKGMYREHFDKKLASDETLFLPQGKKV